MRARGEAAPGADGSPPPPPATSAAPISTAELRRLDGAGVCGRVGCSSDAPAPARPSDGLEAGGRGLAARFCCCGGCCGGCCCCGGEACMTRDGGRGLNSPSCSRMAARAALSVSDTAVLASIDDDADSEAEPGATLPSLRCLERCADGRAT